MHRKTGFRLFTVGAALLLAFTSVGVVLADGIQGDTDALATSAPSANGLDATQNAGTTVLYDYSAFIKETGNASDNVFAGSSDTVTASVSVTQNDLGWATSLTDTSFTFDAYNQNKAGQLSVTVPADAVSAALNHIKVEIQVTNVSNGQQMATDFVVLNYNITVGSPVVPANTPPTVEAGGPYTGNEGADVNIAGTATDPDDTLTTLWTIAIVSADPGTTCSFGDATALNTTVKCTDNGAFTLTLTATGDPAGPVSGVASLTLANVNPVVGSATLAAGTDTCSVNLSAAFSDAGVNDTHTASVAWGDLTSSAGTVTETAQSGTGTVGATHSFATIGTYSATVTVTDDNGGSGSLATNTLLAGYKTGGILQPINPGPPTSIFKWGSTIPVKIQITNCNGSTPTNLSLYITIASISGNTPAFGDQEVSSTSAADTGNLMRFSSPQYIYNLYTKTPYFPDPTATYSLKIRFGSSSGPVVASAVIGLRN